MNSQETFPKNSRVLILGHRGLVGSALVRRFTSQGFQNILTVPREQVDLRDQQQTRDFFLTQKPDFVIQAAARVGGIVANSSFPYQFIYDNLMITSNVIESSRLAGVKKTLVLGSTCIYPRLAPQPIREESLLTGPLESTNEWYAVAKIAGIKLGQAARREHGMCVISAMPTNLYGPNDNYDLQSAHVLPALIRKFHQAKVQGNPEVVMWGTGTPRREFLHVDDLARALHLLMDVYDHEDIVNVGCGQDITILELAQTVGRIVGFEGQIVLDTSKPDGTPKKQTDIGRISALGWAPQIGLEDGIREAYNWFLQNYPQESAVVQSAS